MDIPKNCEDSNDNNDDNHLDNLNENNSEDRYKKKENVIRKRCPFCKVINEKNNKSNITKCINLTCGKEWCYLCGNEWHPCHYSFFGGCPFLEHTECCFEIIDFFYSFIVFFFLL